MKYIFYFQLTTKKLLHSIFLKLVLFYVPRLITNLKQQLENKHNVLYKNL